MNKGTIYILATIGGIGLYLGLSYLFSGKDEFPYGESKNGLSIVLKESGQGVRKYLISSKGIGGDASVISVSNSKDGQLIVDSELYGVKSSFESRAAPYPGAITTTISCATQAYIKEQSLMFLGQATELILAVASNRQIFGICTNEEIKYAAAVWSAFDTKRAQVVTVRLFKAIKDIKDITEVQAELTKVLERIIN